MLWHLAGQCVNSGKCFVLCEVISWPANLGHLRVSIPDASVRKWTDRIFLASKIPQKKIAPIGVGLIHACELDGNGAKKWLGPPAQGLAIEKKRLQEILAERQKNSALSSRDSPHLSFIAEQMVPVRPH